MTVLYGACVEGAWGGTKMVKKTLSGGPEKEGGAVGDRLRGESVFIDQVGWQINASTVYFTQSHSTRELSILS